MDILPVKWSTVHPHQAPRAREISPALNYHPGSRDVELIRGCLEQDRLAQKYLYERYAGKTLGIAMRYTRDYAEAIGVLNQAFLQVFKSLKTYEDRGSLGAWIATIVLRTAIRQAKSQSRYQQKMDFESEADQPVQNEVLLQQEMEVVFSYLQQLPTATRTVFSMYVLDGFKHREIAEQLQISVSTSKWHLANGRKLLEAIILRKNTQ